MSGHSPRSSSAREPCVGCGEETAVGSIFFSDRHTVEHSDGTRAYLCTLCDARIRSSRKSMRLTDEEVRNIVESGSMGAISWAGRGGGTLVSRTVGADPNQLYNSLSKGDLIFMDWTDDNIIDHVRVEAGWGTPPRFGYQPSYNNSYWTTGDWADQHTEVRYHDFWNGYYQLDATTRRTVQIFQVHIDPLNV